MSQLTIVIIIAVITIVGFHILYLKKKKAVSGTEFAVSLIATILLFSLVWFSSSKEGKIEYKILITIVGVSSMITKYISYRKGKAV